MLCFVIKWDMTKYSFDHVTQVSIVSGLVLSIGFLTCRNLSLGLATKARACKVVSQEGSPGVTSYAHGSAKECEGMNPHTPK
jgi:hypothetical protein